MVRQLATETDIVLSVPDCIGPIEHPDVAIYCNRGILDHVQNKRRTRIAKGVITISAPAP